MPVRTPGATTSSVDAEGTAGRARGRSPSAPAPRTTSPPRRAASELVCSRARAPGRHARPTVRAAWSRTRQWRTSRPPSIDTEDGVGVADVDGEQRHADPGGWLMAYELVAVSGLRRPYAISHRPSALGSEAAGRSAVTADHGHVAGHDAALAPSAWRSRNAPSSARSMHVARHQPARLLDTDVATDECRARAPGRGDGRKPVAHAAARSAPRAGEQARREVRRDRPARRWRCAARSPCRAARRGNRPPAALRLTPMPRITTRAAAGAVHLGQNAGHLSPVDQHVVRPFDRRRDSHACTVSHTATPASRLSCEQPLDRQGRAQHDREVQVAPRRRCPARPNRPRPCVCASAITTVPCGAHPPAPARARRCWSNRARRSSAARAPTTGGELRVDRLRRARSPGRLALRTSHG